MFLSSFYYFFHSTFTVLYITYLLCFRLLLLYFRLLVRPPSTSSIGVLECGFGDFGEDGFGDFGEGVLECGFGDFGDFGDFGEDELGCDDSGIGPAIIGIALIGALAVAIALLDINAAIAAALAGCSKFPKKLRPRFLSVLRINRAASLLANCCGVICLEKNLGTRDCSNPRIKAIVRCFLLLNTLQSHNCAVLSELPVAKTLPFG